MTVAAAVAWTTFESAIATWVRNASGLPVIWSAQNKGQPAPPYIALRVRASKRVPNNFVAINDNPLAFAAKVASGVASGVITATAHGLALGDGPVQLTTTGTLPTGYALATDYWIIPVDVDHVKLATSFARARAGSFVATSSAGTGALSIASVAATRKAGAEILFTAGAYVDLTLTLQCFAATTAGATGVTGALQILDQVLAAYMLPSLHDALNAAGVSVYDFGTVTAQGEKMNTTVFQPRAVVDVKIYLDSNVSEPGTIIEFVELTDQNRDHVFEVDS